MALPRGPPYKTDNCVYHLFFKQIRVRKTGDHQGVDCPKGYFEFIFSVRLFPDCTFAVILLELSLLLADWTSY